MANTPIGLGPNSNSLGIDQTADTKAQNTLQFHSPVKGSPTAERLRGKIAQLRSATIVRNESIPNPNFRQLKSPSPQVSQLIDRLQRSI